MTQLIDLSALDASGQGDIAAVLLDPASPAPPGLRAWNGSDPSARLAVHRNHVTASLVDALADTFPVVQQLVGTAFFRAMALQHVRQTPPRTPVLAHYGQDFPDFIAGFEPALGLHYLPDMARLEAARVQAYHAADAEAVSQADLAAALASGDKAGELRLQLHPSLLAVASPHAVVSLWAAHQQEGDVLPVDIDVPEQAVVLRHELDVLVLPVPAGTVEFMRGLQASKPLAEAAEHALAAAPDFDLAAALSLLLTHGALCAIQPPTDSRS
jgi:hypothetical protein